MVRSSTVAWMSVAVGIALAPMALHAQAPAPPAGTTDQAQSRPSRVHDALRMAMDAYRRGDYELAATLFQQAQVGQEDLTPAERRDLTNLLQLNGSALKARRDGSNQLRQAEDALRLNRTQDALSLLKSIAPNQQFLTPTDKQRFGQLSAKVMPSQGSPASPTTAGNAAGLAQARSKLKQARMLMAKGNYDAAQALAHEAEGLRVQLQAGEDTPQKVLEDISHTRTLTVTSNDPKLLMSAARDAFNRGNLDEAEQLAKQADQSSTMWSSMAHLWGDSPSKVLRDVSTARAMKTVATAPPKDSSTKESSTTFTALKTFMGKNDNSAAPGADKQQLPTDNTEKGRQLLKQARQALQGGNAALAKQLADQARALKPELSWWEDTPDKILAEVRDVEAKKQPALASTTNTAAPPDNSQDPRQLLKQARELYSAGKLEEAQTLAQKANSKPTHWGLFEDSPDKLMLDVRKARLKRDQEEAVHALVEARKLFEQGSLAEAERQAHRAERLHGPYSIWDLGDRPQKLLAEIDTAKSKNLKPNIPAPPVEVAKKDVDKPKSTDKIPATAVEVAKKEVDKPKLPDKSALAQNSPPPPVWPEPERQTASKVQPVMASNLSTSPNPAAPVFGSAVGADKKIQARALLADARQLQKEGRLVEARQKAEDARNTGANFGPDEDRPELVMLALSALCQKRIEGLMQQAGDGAAANGDSGRYQRAELDLKQARQLALAFKLDTQLQLIDNKIAWMQQIRDKPATPAPTTGQAQISQMHHQEPAAASVANPSQHGLELLKQARLELRAGQTSSARRLAETAFSGPYGVQDQAAQILRSIDAEEFNQRVLTANRTYEAAMEAFHRQEYPQAATILRSIDPQLLTADKQARLKEIMLMPGMQPTAVAQAGLRETGGAPQRESAAGQPGRAVASDGAHSAPAAAGQPGRAVASDGAHSAPAAARPVQPEADFAKQVAALQEVKFQKLRADGLQAQSEATRRFQAGETDRALDILQDHGATLRDSGLDADKLALLQRPIDSRLQQLRTLKHQRDFEKLQASQHETAEQNLARTAKQEQTKKEQIAELMKQYNASFRGAKYKEAEMYAMRAKELDPDDVVAGAAIYTARTQANLVTSKDARQHRDDMAVDALNYAEDPGPSVDSYNPLKIDPARYLQSKDRKPIDLGGLTTIKNEQERKIYRRLDGPVSSLDYKDTPLKQILDDLQVTAGINIVPDEPALNEAGISLDRPITMKLEGVSMKSALSLLLRQARLTYVVGDEVLKVTTEDQARGRMVTKVHPVPDLVIPVQDSSIPNSSNSVVRAAWGQVSQDNPNLKLNSATPYLGQNSMAGASTPINQSQSAMGASAPGSPGTPAVTKDPKGTMQEELIRLIQSVIAPLTWREVGGQATIEYYPLGFALVITQTPDIQEQVAELLGALRKLEDQQVSVEIRFITIAESFFERIGMDFNINIRNDQTKYEPQLVSQQFRPFGFINHFSPNNFVTGLTPAGSFTQDLNIPIKTSSYQMAVPPFGAYPALPGGNGGLSLGLAFLSDIEVYMFMEAAQGDQRTNVMQAPKLTMYNGAASTITVADTQFFVTTVTVAQLGGQVVFVPNNMPFMTGGMALAILPVISADRRFVRLSVAPTLMNLTNANVQLFPITTFITPIFEGGAVGQPVPFTQFLQQPVFNTIMVMTTVNVPDGGTVLIGGLKRLSEGRNEFGPPILSKIPYINRLFKNVGYGRETESLLMMVTPRIIINEEEEQRQVLGGAPGPAGP